MTGFGINEIEEEWIKEKTEIKLTDMRDDFYKNTASYVAELRRELEHSENLRKEFLEEELKQIIRMIYEIHSLRLLKIMSKYNEKDITKSLLDEEKQVFHDIKGVSGGSYDKIVMPTIKGRAELRPPRKTENTAIIFISEVPEPIIGADMYNYGPFKPGDIVNLPGASANILINQGLAKRLKIRDL